MSEQGDTKIEMGIDDRIYNEKITIPVTCQSNLVKSQAMLELIINIKFFTNVYAGKNT